MDNAELAAAVQQNSDQIAALGALMRNLIEQHQHGQDASNTQFNSLYGMVEVVSAAPTLIPSDVYDQIKIYVSGTTYRLYCYDYIGHAWHYVALT